MKWHAGFHIEDTGCRYRVQIQGCSVLSLMLLIVGPLQNAYLKMKCEVCGMSS